MAVDASKCPQSSSTIVLCCVRVCARAGKWIETGWQPCEVARGGGWGKAEEVEEAKADAEADTDAAADAEKRQDQRMLPKVQDRRVPDEGCGRACSKRSLPSGPHVKAEPSLLRERADGSSRMRARAALRSRCIVSCSSRVCRSSIIITCKRGYW